MRDGTRWYHPETPILPLVVLRPDGLAEVRCLACRRFLHFDRLRASWRHHQRPWNLRHNPRPIPHGIPD